jgi:ferredoxin
MNISRKDFFKKSLLSLGEAVFTVKDALTAATAAAPMTIADSDDFVPAPQDNLMASAHNDTCLAKNSGCFACMERCETGAIKLIPGVGVRINQQLCTGCGSCEYVCPVTPKAITLIKRPAE